MDRFIPSRREYIPIFNIDKERQKALLHKTSWIKPSFKSDPEETILKLHAGSLIDNFYASPIDWSSRNTLAIGVLPNDLCLYNFSKKEPISTDTFFTSPILSLNFNKDGSHLAISFGEKLGVYNVENELVVSNYSSGNNNSVLNSVWNDNLLCFGENGGGLHLYDVRFQSRITNTLGKHADKICNLKWNRDNTLLASGSNDNTLKIWDLRSTKPISTLAHNSAVKAMAWSPDCKNTIVTGGGIYDKQLRVWNTKGIVKKKIDTGSQVTSIFFSKSDFELVITKGYDTDGISTYDYPDLKCTKTINNAHFDRILHTAQSPDGSVICTGSADGILKFWEIFNKKANKHKEPFIDKCDIR